MSPHFAYILEKEKKKIIIENALISLVKEDSIWSIDQRFIIFFAVVVVYRFSFLILVSSSFSCFVFSFYTNVFFFLFDGLNSSITRQKRIRKKKKIERNTEKKNNINLPMIRSMERATEFELHDKPFSKLDW